MANFVPFFLDHPVQYIKNIINDAAMNTRNTFTKSILHDIYQCTEE